jgi:trehalose-phosphatase
MRYIFDDLKAIGERLRDKQLLLFLDFDGTLAPIADTPGKAVIPEKTKKILVLLSKKTNCAIAIISGRGLPDIKKKVGLKGIIYSGNHGFQIEGPKLRCQLAVPVAYKNRLQGIEAGLKKKLSGIKGVLIEDKKFFLALHFRLADKRKLPFIKTIFRQSVIQDLKKNKVTVKFGKKVFEIGPPLYWNKGKIVLSLLGRQRVISGKQGILPVYIGDDKTDEDAFRVLKRKGLTVHVGKSGNSAAAYYLRDTKEVAEFLDLISKVTT